MTMSGPRKPGTKKLERARRQFFQLHFVEKLRISEIKEKMDVLSRDTGEDFVVELASPTLHWKSLS